MNDKSNLAIPILHKKYFDFCFGQIYGHPSI